MGWNDNTPWRETLHKCHYSVKLDLLPMAKGHGYGCGHALQTVSRPITCGQVNKTTYHAKILR